MADLGDFVDDKDAIFVFFTFALCVVAQAKSVRHHLGSFANRFSHGL